MSLDREKFVKVLMLSTSDHDDEALAAIRMCCRMLKAERLSWTDLLSSGDIQFGTEGIMARAERKYEEAHAEHQAAKRLKAEADRILAEAKRMKTQAGPAPAAQADPFADSAFGPSKAQRVDEPTVQEMFDALFEHYGSLEGAPDFVQSVYDQWDRFQRLSPKQIAALKRFYERCH